MAQRIDYGELTMAEVNTKMEAEPGEWVLVDPDGNEWWPGSPEFQNWNPEQVPTDDYQRPLRLVRVTA